MTMNEKEMHELRRAVDDGEYRCGYCNEVIRVNLKSGYVDCINRCTQKVIELGEELDRTKGKPLQ